MHVISEKKLKTFWEAHPDAKTPLKAWYSLLSSGQYSNTSELKASFGSVDLIKRNSHVFNIGGNKYRILANMEFQKQQIYILEVMTHAQYDTDFWKSKWNLK